MVSHSLLQKSYALGSPERAAVQAAIAQMEQELPFEVPVIVNGEPVSPELCMYLWTAIELTDVRLRIDSGSNRSRRASSPNS